MRILYVTSEIPYPPANGVRIPVYHSMRLMRQAGHHVALAALSDEIDAVGDRLEHMASFCDAVIHRRLDSRNPWRSALASMVRHGLYYMERYRSPKFRSGLSDLIETYRPQVVHFDTILMTQYIHCLRSGIGSIASINDSWALTLEHSLEKGYYSGLSRLYRRMEYWATLRYERTAYEKFSFVHTMTERDASYLRHLNPGIRTIAIPNGVDQSLLQPRTSESGDGNVLFMAKLVGLNLTSLRRFLAESWPVVREQIPEARLHIVGELTEEARSLREGLSESEGIYWCGFVPSLSDAYRQCGIAVVPIDKNMGIVNKALEAMAAGLAVVGFRSVFEGISGAEMGTHYIGVDDYTAMGHAITELVHNRKKRDNIQRAASMLMREQHSWESRLEALNSMYVSAAN